MIYRKKTYFLFFVIVFIYLLFPNKSAYAQNQSSFFSPSDTLNHTRKSIVYNTYYIGAPASLFGLYHLWYKEGGMSGLKIFNDNKDWLQLDKLGHATSAYHIGECAIKSLRWAGVDDRTAIIHGGLASLIYMTGIEILDGFAVDYGFSYGDAIANLFGVSMLVGQELMWNEQRIRIKYSFFPSEYAEMRPELLGQNLISQTIKDYNAQTYWLSVNLKSNFNIDFVPDWLNVAFGYGGYNMTGGTSNPKEPIATVHIPDDKRTRQYFFSLDVDLTKIETKSPFLNSLFSLFGFVKFPFTALEYNQKDGFLFHPVYF